MALKQALETNWSGVRRAALLGIGIGAAYGVLARLLADPDLFSYVAILSLTFLGLVPVVVGYLAVFPATAPRLWYRIVVPWIPTVLSVVATAVVGWEGAICIIVSLPLLLILASVGGIIAGAHQTRRGRHAAIVAVLPFVVAPLETTIPRPSWVQLNVTETTVDASPEIVWRHVIEVPTIREHEQREALYTRIGFPRPISAELSHEGLGGVRHARFEGNVLFIEKITAWETQRRIAFTIDALTDSIPPTTLDPHVTIGGEYFDILTGEYRLVPLHDGRTRLLLISRHRVSTTLNAYTGWWARTIMRSIQRNILKIVRDRAERDAAARGESRQAMPAGRARAVKEHA
jgi:hypothetical protein